VKRLWTSCILGLVAVVVAVAPHLDTPEATPVAASVAVQAVASTASLTPVPPTVEVLHNDPKDRPHAISDVLIADIDAVPAGETIDVTTYWISHEGIAASLTRAFQRGVVLHILVDGGPRADHPRSVALERLLNAVTTDDAWMIRSAGATRGSGGIMHEKTWRFSRVGDLPWVTVTGSWNASDHADVMEYAAMWRVTNRQDIYDRYAQVAAAQRLGRTERPGLRQYAEPDWSAYFLPGAVSASADPVLHRLRAIPARRGTVVRISMYSMWGDRAGWLSRRLARMSRAGAQVTFVAGPTVSATARSTLRHAGVRVVGGCWRDGTFVHSKDMSASYLVNGQRVWWTWIGSDNWTSQNMVSDQAVLGVRGADAYAQFGSAFLRAAQRPGGLQGRACHEG
jgi:hypothetical protein